MTKVITASQARSDIYNLIDETAQSHEPIIITGKRHNAVMLSQEDWKAIEETLYLTSIPNMAQSITDAMNASDRNSANRSNGRLYDPLQQRGAKRCEEPLCGRIGG